MSTSRSGNTASPIERIDVSAYKVPTDAPESDGTYEWDRPRWSWSRHRRAA